MCFIRLRLYSALLCHSSCLLNSHPFSVRYETQKKQVQIALLSSNCWCLLVSLCKSWLLNPNSAIISSFSHSYSVVSGRGSTDVFGASLWTMQKSSGLGFCCKKSQLHTVFSTGPARILGILIAPGWMSKPVWVWDRASQKWFMVFSGIACEVYGFMWFRFELTGFKWSLLWIWR